MTYYDERRYELLIDTLLDALLERKGDALISEKTIANLREQLAQAEARLRDAQAGAEKAETRRAK